MELEANKATTLVATVLAIDHSNLSYKACSLCDRTLPDSPNSRCAFCCNSSYPSSSFKRLFRLLVSIASDTKVLNVICFDRAARVFFGCSADEFFDFAKFHPSAAQNGSMILEGEMFKMTLSKPKNGNAQHLRAVSVLPFKTGFQPVIESLRELYGARTGSPCFISFSKCIYVVNGKPISSRINLFDNPHEYNHLKRLCCDFCFTMRTTNFVTGLGNNSKR